MARTAGARHFAAVYRRLQRRYGAEVTLLRRSPLEQLFLTIVAEGATFRQARQARERLLQHFVDWNEVRLSRLAEIRAVLDDLRVPDLTAKIARFRDLMRAAFERYHRVTLDVLGELKFVEVKKVLGALGPLGDQGAEAVFQYALGNKVVAVFAPLRRAAAALGLCRPDEPNRVLAQRITQQLDADDVNEFCLLLTEYGDQELPVEKPPRRRDRTRPPRVRPAVVPVKNAPAARPPRGPVHRGGARAGAARTGTAKAAPPHARSKTRARGEPHAAARHAGGRAAPRTPAGKKPVRPAAAKKPARPAAAKKPARPAADGKNAAPRTPAKKTAPRTPARTPARPAKEGKLLVRPARGKKAPRRKGGESAARRRDG